MEPERLNRWLTLGANFGVLLGILLLVFELNQSRELVRSEIRNELSNGVAELFRQIAENGELANIVFRGNSGEELSPEESFRYSSFMKSFFRYAANVHYQYRNGMYDDFEYVHHRDAWRDLFGLKSVAKVWCGYRATFSDEFKAEMDSLLTDEC